MSKYKRVSIQQIKAIRHLTTTHSCTVFPNVCFLVYSLASRWVSSCTHSCLLIGSIMAGSGRVCGERTCGVGYPTLKKNIGAGVCINSVTSVDVREPSFNTGVSLERFLWQTKYFVVVDFFFFLSFCTVSYTNVWQTICFLFFFALYQSWKFSRKVILLSSLSSVVPSSPLSCSRLLYEVPAC